MKLKVGDIFKIPIDDKKYGIGQIVKIPDKSSLVVIFFEKLFEEDISDLPKIITDKILLFGNTFDAKFYHKHWIVIDNHTSNLKTIRFPYYKLGTSGELRVEDFNTNVVTEKYQKKFEELDYRTYVAPIELELAFKAYHKLEPWEEGFNDLLYENVIKSVRIVETK